MTTKQARTIVFPPFRLDEVNQQLWCGEEVLALRPKSFAVLAYLLERPGRLVTKEELLDACWPDTEMTYTVLKVSIREIREALGDDPKAPRFIETMHRRGYRFIGQIAEEGGEKQQVRTSGRFVAPLRLRLSSAARGLVGREADLARLRGSLDRALEGERQLVFIVGEAGIGKTALVEAFLLKAAADPRIWLAHGQCLEQFGSSDAYLPVLDAISSLCQEPGREGFVSLLRRHAPLWLLQMPWLAPAAELEALRRETLGGTRERMLREIAEAIEALTAETPLVLVIEDLHWSDYSTLDLISYLARRRERARLLVIGAYRSGEVLLREHPLRSVKQELQAKRLCEELSLEYLDEAAVGEYLAGRFPRSEFPGALARLIHERTKGNPLFMVNAVDYLQAKELVAELDGQWMLKVPLADLEMGVPESIRRMIEKQLDRLSPQEQQALEAASVAGVEFNAAALAASLEKEAAVIEEMCERLTRRQQFLQAAGVSVLPDGGLTARYSFMHSLYQNVLYQQVGEARRVRLHLAMGEQGERVYGEQAGEMAAELAMHFEQGRAYRRAIRYLLQAAENDSRRYANREAVSYLTRALELIERLPEAERNALRLPVFEQLGVARHSMGDARQAVEDFAALARCAREQDQVAGEARALFYLASSLVWLDRARCLDAAGRAFELCLHLRNEPAPSQVRGGGGGYWHALLRGWRAEDASICAEALSAARGAGERSLLVLLVGRQAYFQCLQSEYRAASGTAREGQQLAAEAGNAYEYLFCLYYRAWSLLHLGQWGEARGVAWDGIQMAEKNGHKIWV
ncbi:MAG: ATP-binding protein, partial [Blastocatellia bacterium]